MKGISIFVLFACICLCSADLSSIYVASNATGDQRGTIDAPYASFSAALGDPDLTLGSHIAAFPGTYTGAENYNLEIDPSLTLSFDIYGDGDVTIDFEQEKAGFLRAQPNTPLPIAILGYTFINQAQDSTVPVLSFTSTETTLLSGCTFQNVGFAVSMKNVLQVNILGSEFNTCVSSEVSGPALSLTTSVGTITDTNFVNSHGSKGGAIYINESPNGQISMDTVHILDNIAESLGGGLYIENANVTIVSSVISNNTAKESGGGVYSNFPVSLTSSSVSGNTAGSNGGAIYLGHEGELVGGNEHSVLSSLGLKENIALVGGGIYLDSLAPVFISDCDISMNNATNLTGTLSGLGGGLYVGVSSDAITIDGTSFTFNEAHDQGGAVYIAGPSGTTLFQMRANCDVESNTAGTSGGGVQIAGIVFFASFSDSTISDNVVTDGNGGGFMLAGSASFSKCDIEGNTANNGAGLFINNAGFVSIVESTINSNEASQNGGGINIGTSSGLLVKGGEISANKAPNGGGAYLAPSLPVEFADVTFQSSTNSGSAGSSIYLSGGSQDSFGNVNLVKVRNCAMADSLDEAIYNNGGELLLLDTCYVPGLQVEGGASTSVCGCFSKGTTIKQFQLQSSSGSLLMDNTLSTTSNFDWSGGKIYGVNSSTCVSGLTSGVDVSSLVAGPISLVIRDDGKIGTSGSTSISSGILWNIVGRATISSEVFVADQGSIYVNEDGSLVVGSTDPATVQVQNVHNSGTIQLEKNSLIDGKLSQEGDVYIQYNSPPTDVSDAAKITSIDMPHGKTELTVKLVSASDLDIEDSFYVLQWEDHSGTFRKFDLDGDIPSKTKGALDYEPEALKCTLVKKGNTGGLIGIIIVSVLIVVAIAVGGFFAYRQRHKFIQPEVWDDGAEETKILGQSGVLVPEGEERSLIKDSDL